MYLSLILTFTSRLDVLIEIKVVQDAVHLLNSGHAGYLFYILQSLQVFSGFYLFFTSRVETL